MKTEKRTGVVAICIACALASTAVLSQTSDSQALQARFQAVPEADLKVQYLLCDRVASQRLLGMDEAATCSAVAEVLKVRSFGGDFDAMIAWWRQHRDLPSEALSLKAPS